MRLFLSVVRLAAVALAEDDHGTKVGSLTSYTHGIAGTVYALNEKTLLIKGETKKIIKDCSLNDMFSDFEYDGAGPDTFFWVGTEGEPSTIGTILPYPFNFSRASSTSLTTLKHRFLREPLKR